MTDIDPNWTVEDLKAMNPSALWRMYTKVGLGVVLAVVLSFVLTPDAPRAAYSYLACIEAGAISAWGFGPSASIVSGALSFRAQNGRSIQ